MIFFNKVRLELRPPPSVLNEEAVLYISNLRVNRIRVLAKIWALDANLKISYDQSICLRTLEGMKMI